MIDPRHYRSLRRRRPIGGLWVYDLPPAARRFALGARYPFGAKPWTDEPTRPRPFLAAALLEPAVRRAHERMAAAMVAANPMLARFAEQQQQHDPRNGGFPFRSYVKKV